jgi:hypothetical protein
MNHEYYKTVLKTLNTCNNEDQEIEILREVFNIGAMSKREINIPFSEEDLQELLEGRTFDWTFDDVDVHLYRDDNEVENQEGYYDE